MASQSHQLHVVLIPFMTQGHLIPMIDMAILLAQRGLIVTIISTPLNASRFNTSISWAIESGLLIRVIQLRFPSHEAGLPEGCETMDNLPSRELLANFYVAIRMLQQPVEKLFEEMKPSPSCIISDANLAWPADTARKFQVPRFYFDGRNCFSLLCSHNLHITKVHEQVSESEPFVVLGLPHRITLTRAQLPGAFSSNFSDLNDTRREIRAAELVADGVVVNSFEELEAEYVKEYRKVKGDKIWCIGPVSVCHKEDIDKAQRGNNTSTDQNQCLKWLDSWEPSSVVYACLGSLSNITPPQLIELGLGLEASNCPFILVLRGHKAEEMEKWISDDGFEERTKERGLLIRGWVPQILILSHPAVGGFLTHCGWNSTLEAVSAGLPMITWPFFADQFYNEKLIVQILEIGVSVGVEVSVQLGQGEKFGVLVKWEEVQKAINKVMDEGPEGRKRRERVRKLGVMANKAMEQGGSSNHNIALLIENIKQHATVHSSKDTS